MHTQTSVFAYGRVCVRAYICLYNYLLKGSLNLAPKHRYGVPCEDRTQYSLITDLQN